MKSTVADGEGGRKIFPRPVSISTRLEDAEFETRSPATTPDIQLHSPIPRRHLVESAARYHWLAGSIPSPASSRAVSPTSAVSRSPTHSLRKPGTGSWGRRSSVLPTVPEERRGPEGMGKRWIRWMHRSGMKAWVLPSILLTTTLVKFCLSLGTYSGHNAPPMFGDYEAQRHWMEVTIHVPLSQWYYYDLLYWGLDYPPLTAYVSWLCGIVGSWINPSWFALDDSRGIETPGSKLFMRSTVFVLDALFYVIPIVLYSRTWLKTRSIRTQNLAVLTLLLHPALLLIDFGHFQYNGVMLGLTVQALNFFKTGHDLLGAVCFVLSLGFKQMALYYAPAVGIYLLSKCVYLGSRAGIKLFLRLGITTVLTLVLVFLPFFPVPSFPLSIPSSIPPSLLQPIIRMFPFGRGLFEDKVANFWCATNVIVKWKERVPRGDLLVKLSTILTGSSFFPGIVMVFLTVYNLLSQPTPSAPPEGGEGDDETVALNIEKELSTPNPHVLAPLLPFILLNSSIAFFLFSFQVHEKTILLPLLPLTLAFSGSLTNDSDENFMWGALVNNTAVFSMWPLLQKDGLQIQYVAMLILWNRVIGYNPFQNTVEIVTSLLPDPLSKIMKIKDLEWINFLGIAVHTAAIGLHILEWLILPPSRYPDLYPVLNVLICTPVFFLTWIWSVRKCVEVCWAVSGPALGPPAVTPSLRPRTSSNISSQGSVRRRRISQQLLHPNLEEEG